jgi:hypothetical protein
LDERTSRYKDPTCWLRLVIHILKPWSVCSVRLLRCAANFMGVLIYLAVSK